MYTWTEGVAPDEITAFGNIRLKRLSIDVLLPGPTSMSQIQARVANSCDKITIKYTPPATFHSARRTAVRIATGLVDGRHVGQTINFTMATARATAHSSVLENLSEDEKSPTFEIPLPFKVDPYFCRRNDFGIDNAGHGIDIGVYRHEDTNFQANNQYVWLLHIELSAAQRPVQALRSPGSIGEYHRFA